MSNANDQAFPVPGTNLPNGEFSHPWSGLTKREYAAIEMAKALAPGLVSTIDGFNPWQQEALDALAERSVRMADTLLAELSK